MRILVIIEKFPPDVSGGYELRCEEACYWLKLKGYHLDVLTSQSERRENTHPFSVHRLLQKYPSGRMPAGWPTWKKLYFALLDNYFFSRVLSCTKPDLIYVWKSSEISRSLIPKIFQTPVRKLVDNSAQWFHKVVTQHGPVYRFLESSDGSLINRAIKKCIVMVLPFISFGLFPREYVFDWNTLTGYFTSHWNKKFHVDAIPECESFPVFYTGVDLDDFPFRQKDYLSETIRLLFVGRIEEDKGFYLLLEQINQVKSTRILLTVAGQFPNQTEKGRAEALIKEMGLENKIVFLGQINRDRLPLYYHQSDFTVFPSIWDEPFSRVPLESMACGTPCISTDNPGSKELFDLKAPLILLERNRDSLANIIEAFPRNNDQYARLSLDGRKFVESSFTFDHFMKNIERTFLMDEDMSRDV
jgi:glycosyltransferase involved in cell wall biosynthesis